MDTVISPYRVHQCSKCPGDTEYYCESCLFDLCPQCKENHLKDLKTIEHNVATYCDEINYIPTQEIYARDQSNVYSKYCEPCQVPVRNNCQTHGKHKQIDVKIAYTIKRHQHRATIHTIRSQALFYRPVLLTEIKADVKTCHTEFIPHQSEMLTKAYRLKSLIDYVLFDLLNNVFCDFDFKHRCLNQKIEMSRHIVSLQRYEHRYVQPAFTFSALKFLSFIKTALLKIHLKLHTNQLSMTESLNKEDVMESLSAIQITEMGNRRVGNQCLLKRMSAPELYQSFKVTDVGCCYHISCVTSDWVWVSDEKSLILTDTTGVPLHSVEDFCCGLYTGNGLHTVNSESKLIYIDKHYNINKLSKDMKTTTTFIKRDSIWEPRCVYWSPYTGDLLVGMYYTYTVTGKVNRYNQRGQLTQTIEDDNTGRALYSKPNYITENNNGDIVVSVSWSGAVVVTERGGRHRFSYTGLPSGSEQGPYGICIDALSHILVCYDTTKTVHMLNKDGQFLSYLLTESLKMRRPLSLSYDVKTHRLWVGSWYNKMCVYRYITRQDALTGSDMAEADVLVLHDEEAGNLFQAGEGEEWPEGGMTCPVTGCTGSGHHFKKLSKYSAHFERFHKPNIFIFHCPICNIKDARPSEITRHMKKHHKCQSPPHIPSKEVKNCKFIDPCDFKKPKKRIYHAERKKARLERINSLPKEPLFELSDKFQRP